MTIAVACVAMHIAYDLRYVGPHALGKVYLLRQTLTELCHIDSKKKSCSRSCDVAQLRETADES